MREFDENGGGVCEEELVTQLWLEDTAPYVRVDYDMGRGGIIGKGRREGGSTGDAAAPFDSPSAPGLPR
jgi:hypothetical protein